MKTVSINKAISAISLLAENDTELIKKTFEGKSYFDVLNDIDRHLVGQSELNFLDADILQRVSDKLKED